MNPSKWLQPLKRSKNALNSNSVSGQGVSAKIISGDRSIILEKELDNARSDFSQSRQSLYRHRSVPIPTIAR